MRKLVAFAALLALVPNAQAQDSELTHSGQFRTRYQYDQNISGIKDGSPSSQNAFTSQFRYGATFRASEQFTGHLGLIHQSTWGNETNTPEEMNDTSNYENALFVREAYGSWMVNDEFLLRFGRGALQMGAGRVLSPNDWEAIPYSFEGVLGTYDMEFTRISAFGVKFADYSGGGEIDDPEVNAFGLSFDIKALPEWLKMANIHVLQTNADVASATPDHSFNSMRYGLTLGGDMAGLDYSLTYASHSGEGYLTSPDVDTSGSMYHVELGYSMEALMNSRFYVTYHSDSGDDGTTNDEVEGYDAFYYEKHANAGLMDVVEWGNLTYIAAGYTFMPMDQLELGLHYLMFSRTSDTAEVAEGRTGGTLFANQNAGLDATDIGSEIDVVATKRYDGGFALTARAGMFTPGEYLDKIAGANKVEETYTQVFLEGQMTF